ncbi:MAG: hypothetical protein M1831_000976, partial [Alyxoria varia]
MFRLSPYLLCLIGLIARSRSAIEVDNSLTYLLLRGDPLPQQDDNQNTGLDEAFNADFDLFQRLTEFIDQSEAQPPPPPAGWGDDPQGTFFGRSAIYRGYRTGEYTDGPPDHRNIAEDEQLFFDLSALTEAHRRELQGLRAQQNGEVDSSPGKTPVEEG